MSFQDFYFLANLTPYFKAIKDNIPGGQNIPLLGSTTNLIWGSQYINGANALIKMLPYFPDLLNFLHSPTSEIKDLHLALRYLKDACAGNDFEEFVLNLKNVQSKIHTILENDKNYENQFTARNTGTTWEEYLLPLQNLDNEITKALNATKLEGYNLEDLSTPLQQVINFINNEIEGQSGLLNKNTKKAATCGYNALKNAYDEMSEATKPKPGIQIPKHPLMKLMDDIGHFRTLGKKKSRHTTNQALMKDIKSLEKSDDRLKGLSNFILQYAGKNLLDSVDTLVSQFLVIQLGQNNEAFFQKFYDITADRKGSKPLLNTPQKQQDWAKEFLSSGAIKKEDVEILWHAATYALEYDTIEEMEYFLEEIESNPSLIPECLDKAVFYLSQSQHIPEALPTIKEMTKLIAQHAAERLNKLEIDEDSINKAFDEQHRQYKNGDYRGAVLTLKGIFELIFKKSGQSNDAKQVVSAVGDLAKTFATESESAKGIRSLEKSDITSKRKELVESLSYFATFCAIDNLCSYDGKSYHDIDVQARFAKSFPNDFKMLTEEERKAAFLKALNEQIENDNKIGGFSKFIAVNFSSTILSYVEYFSEHFSSILTEYFYKMGMATIENTLEENSLGIFRVANRTFLAMNQATDKWKNNSGVEKKESKGFFASLMETTDELKNSELDGKESKIAENLSAQRDYKELTKKVVNIALDSLNPIYSIPLRFFLSVTGLVDSMMNTIHSSLASDKRITGSLNQVFLDQLQNIQTSLADDHVGVESGEVLTNDIEKKLVNELVSNLFIAIENGQIFSPNGSTGQASLFGNLKGMTEDQIKKVVVDLIISMKSSLLTKDGIHSLFNSVMDITNQTLQPNPDRIQEFFTKKEWESIKDKPEQVILDEFAKIHGCHFETISGQKFDDLLNQKYLKNEKEIEHLLEDVLENATEKEVKNLAKDILKTEEESIFEFIHFIENQVLPHVQVLQTKSSEKNYFEKMDELCKNEDAEGLQQVHSRFLEKMHYLLQKMNNINSHSQNALQKRALIRTTERINKNLTELSDAVVVSIAFIHKCSRFQKEIENKNSKTNQQALLGILTSNQSGMRTSLKTVQEKLTALKGKVKSEESTINAIKYAFDLREKPILEKAAEKVQEYTKLGAEVISPVIASVANSVIKAPIDGVVGLAKDTNVLKTFFRETLVEVFNYNET